MAKDVRIRMGKALINKAFANIHEVFNVMLAVKYNDKKFDTCMREHKDVVPAAYISKKIDGVRLITIINDEGKIKFYSRTGHEYVALNTLRDEITSFNLPNNTVLDGELVALDENGKEDFKLTMKCRKKKEQMVNSRYHLFDYMTLDEFKNKSVSPIFSVRFDKLTLLPESEHIDVLEQWIYTEETFDTLAEQAKNELWEGLMIKWNHIYIPSRTKYLMKYKYFETEEYKVKDVVIEDMPLLENGIEIKQKALSSIVIEHKGCEVHVGSGFSNEERISFAKNPKLIIGKLVEIEYQEESVDKKKKTRSLRCPIFKGLIGDARDF